MQLKSPSRGIDRILPTDLRLRIVAAVFTIACISQLKALPVSAGVALVVVLAVVWSEREKQLWHRMLHVEGFMILLFATLPFTMPGRPLFGIGPLTASIEGVERAALIACKVSAATLMLMAMLGDVEPVRLGGALRALRVPDVLNQMFVMTGRYVFLLRDEARRLQDAMRARAFRAGSNRHTWRSYGNLIGMLLVRALDRAHRIEEAMMCRGYDGRFPSTPLPAPTVRDWAGFVLVAGFGLLALGFDRL